MFITRKHLSRRTVLRGVGAAFALPLLDAMIPAATALAATAAAPKPRLGFVYFPHGAVMDRWKPEAAGQAFEFPQILKPLEAYRSYTTVVSGLRNKGGESPDPHGIIAGTWLSCVGPKDRETTGERGVTADQLAARYIGQDTPLPSLELSGESSGGVACAPGVGCGFADTVAFRTPTQPLPMEHNPRKVFYQLFGQGDTQEERVEIARETGSILDAVMEKAKRMSAELGPSDQAMLSDYLDSVREIERRIAKLNASAATNIQLPDAPLGVPEDFGEQLKVMFELMALAWAADKTRVVSFMMAKEVSMRTYNQIGISDAFHPLSHHQNDPSKLDRLAKIQTYHTTLFANFLKRLSQMPDGDGSLLDHSVILYGSNMSNSDKHNNDPLPSALLGRAYGRVKGGRHVHYPQDTPHANLLLTMLNRAGIPLTSLGNSSGLLAEVLMRMAACRSLWFAMALGGAGLAHAAAAATAAQSATAAPSAAAGPSAAAPPTGSAELELIHVMEEGDRSAALEAIRQGTSVRARDADGTTALHWAASQGDAELVHALIAAGADVRARNDFGATPMSAAAEIGDARVIEMLLKAGADVESPNGEGETALMMVARTGRVDAARLLLKRGANPNAREHWGGQTALMWSAAQCQPEMMRLLLDHGASVDLRGTARDWQRRVTAEPRPKDMSHGGFSALLYAAREGCVAGARELVRRKADLNLADPDGVTPLILALMNIHWDFARYLIEAGADVNLWDFYGRAPLYAAVDMNTLPKGRHVELPSLDDTAGLTVIRMLLDRGANPNAQLKLRVPHRQIPYDRYTEPMLNIGATPLLRAAKAGDIEVVKLLLAHGALPDLPNFNGDTPLMAAVGKGWINAPTRGAFYTEDQAIEVYALLRSAGANVNAHTHFNQTPLHNAALRGWNEIVKRLVADGAELDASDGNGLTPLDFAMGRIPKEFNAVVPTVRNDTADLLKSLGAKVEHPNLPPWPAASTPRITAWVPGDTALLPPQ